MWGEISDALWELEKLNGTVGDNFRNNLSPAVIAVVVLGLVCTGGLLGTACMQGLPPLRRCPQSQQDTPEPLIRFPDIKLILTYIMKDTYMLQGLFGAKTPSYSQEDLDILRLIRSENVGNRTFISLVKMFGSATIALENVQDFARRGGRSKPIKICAVSDAEKEI